MHVQRGGAMKIDLYSFVGIYSRGLGTLAHLLRKGSEHAAASGVFEEEMLDWRLAEDMFPLRRQAQIVCNFAQQWPARAAGLSVPEGLKEAPTMAELLEGIADAKSYLQGLESSQFEGRDEVPLTMNLGSIAPTMPLGQWVAGFATTNFYFHLSIAYAILRSRGVALTKPDLFAGGL
jgi:hypothetical protein